MVRSLMHLVWLSVLFFHATYAVDCYGVNGIRYPNNVLCPGSDACCGVNATCLPNRLCRNRGQDSATFVRGPCAVTPYSATDCAQICIYNETAVSGGFFPRVSTCSDGSLCCSNDPSCCEDGTGVFLDRTGKIVASLESSSSTTQSSASSTAQPSSSISSLLSSSSTDLGSPLTTTTSSILPSQTDSDSAIGNSRSSSSLSTGAKVGLGVGIPLGIACLVGIAVIIWLQHRRIKQVTAQSMVNNPTHQWGTQQLGTEKWEPPKEIDSNLSPMAVELPAGNKI